MGRNEERLVRAQMQREREAKAQAEQAARDDFQARRQEIVRDVRAEIPLALARLADAGYPGASEFRPPRSLRTKPGWNLGRWGSSSAYTLTVDGELWVNSQRGVKRVTDKMLAHTYTVTEWDYSSSREEIAGQEVLYGLRDLGSGPS